MISPLIDNLCCARLSLLYKHTSWLSWNLSLQLTIIHKAYYLLITLALLLPLSTACSFVMEISHNKEMEKSSSPEETRVDESNHTKFGVKWRYEKKRLNEKCQFCTLGLFCQALELNLLREAGRREGDTGAVRGNTLPDPTRFFVGVKRLDVVGVNDGELDGICALLSALFSKTSSPNSTM